MPRRAVYRLENQERKLGKSVVYLSLNLMFVGRELRCPAETQRGQIHTFFTFCLISILRGLDDVHSHWGEPSALLGL